ncbi:hypothetical protein NEMBOFW57_006255 [Staphylotrichum longicolle]|uniref:CCHC-type domain-containing protein n=1 Tax=Staphylotrichum longicolle TaxID=669026 RepID=A0AAD4I2F9_9PEZI|nr:hypothetical protein NEMBOFW57_006255 [Staphylotrichum longicolle]
MADPFGIVGVAGVIGQIAQVAVKLGLDWKDAPVDVKGFITEIQTLKTVLSETHVNILVNDDFKNAFDGRHSTLMAVDALALGARIYKEITEARKEQQGWQTNRENKAVLDWVTTADYSSQQSDFIRRRQAGTGQWLLDSTEYQQWTETAKQTLFCPGIPGAGKTILTSIVVDDLHERFRDDVCVGIAYLYCNFRRQADQKVEDLLSTLIRQLSQDQSSLPECLRIFYDKHKGRARPSLDELSRVLQAVADLFSRIFIVVDALDECQLSDGSRSKLLTELFALQSKTGANIFATSRFILDVTERFKNNVSLEIRAHPGDVQRYIEGNMAHMPLCVTRSPDLHKEVITKIVQAVDGMSAKAVRVALETLYTGSQAYDYAYDNAMDRIEGQLKDQEELAKQVLSWITCAKRPLSTTELQHALGVEVGETELDPDNIPLVEDIVSVCAGLVTVDEESSIIRLVHYTTQEYFVRTWKRWFPDAQVEITDVCATYLSFSPFVSGPCRTNVEFEDRLRSNQLYDYAACYWGEHAREAGGISRVALDLLKRDSLVEAQVQAMMMIKRPWSFRSYNQVFPKRMQGLLVAAYFGILGAVETLLQSSNNNDLKDSFGRTPLSWAAGNGHEAVVKMLLDTGKVGVDLKDNDGRTPLLRAAGNGHEAVVKMLLDTGKVDIDSKANDGRTPLLWAAGNGNDVAVKMLLETGKVDIDLKANNGRTPLSWAAGNGQEAVVKMLLDTGKVDADSKDNDGRTPLLWAAGNGHEAVVKMLLETTNIDAAAEDVCGLMTLQLPRGTGYGAHLGPIDTSAVQKGACPMKKAKSNVTCFNCGKKGHFAKECRGPKKGRGWKPVPGREAAIIDKGVRVLEVAAISYH